MVRELPCVGVEHPARGHLPDLVEGIREPSIHHLSEVPQKRRDSRLELRDRAEAPIEGRVVAQEVVDDVQPVQEIGRERMRQPLVLDFGEFRQEHASEDAEFQSGGTRQAIGPFEAGQGIEVLPGPGHIPVQRRGRVIRQDPIESMKPGCRGPGRIEGPMVLDDPFGQAAKVRDGRSRQGVLPRRGSGLRSKRLAFRWSALGGRILIPGKVLPSAMGRIEADLLIPGRGAPIPNGCIVFDRRSITYAGTIPGPHIHGGGAMLTPTAGHGDLHMFPTSYMRTLEAGGHYVQLCDGVAECLRGVRNQLRVGARVIKVCASGGVMSETDHPIHQQFSEDELRAIVGEAGRAERIVAAHCHGKPGIMAALRAGCGTIEHGSYLDEESVDLLIEKKAILVPTRTSWRCEKIRGRTSQSCPRRRTSWRSGNQVSPSTAVRSRVGTANGASPQTSPLPTERRWIFPSPSSSSRRSSASSSVTPKTAATSRVAQRPRPLRRSRTDSTVASIRLPSIPGST